MKRLIVVLTCLLGLMALQHAQAEQRIALVVGNEAYPPEVGQLQHPHEDAATVASALQNVGFELIGDRILTDADAIAMNKAILAFRRALRDAGPEAVGFFYYSGHGASTDAAGRRENYLIPSGAPIESADELTFLGVNLSSMILSLSTIDAKAVFVISDACRTTLPWEAKNKGGAQPDKGFSVEPLRPGLFIAHATAAGKTAPDDGIFAQELARQIVREREWAPRAIKLAFREVAKRRDVYAVPTVSDLLQSDFCFDGCPGETIGVETEAMRADREAWEVARSEATRQAAQDYLTSYPSGRFAAEAQAMVRAFGVAELETLLRKANDAYDLQDYATAFRNISLACKLESDEGCFKLGNLYEFGDGVAEDKARARRIYETVCDDDYWPACERLGGLYLRGEGGLKDEQKGASLLERACAAGDDFACSAYADWLVHFERTVSQQKKGYELALAHCDETDARDTCFLVSAALWLGFGVEADPVQSRFFAKRSCEAGSRRGCDYYASLLREPSAGAVDNALSTKMFEQACERNYAVACTSLGKSYTGQIGVGLNLAKARASFEKGCDLGDPQGCEQFGNMLASGVGGSKDSARAKRLIEGACNDGFAVACGTLAQALYNGDNILFAQPDKEKGAMFALQGCDLDDSKSCTVASVAIYDRVISSDRQSYGRSLSKKACDLGSANGCQVHGQYLHQGVEGSIDKKGAFEYAKRACEGGGGVGCADVSYHYRNGEGIRRSRSKADDYADKACQLGHEQSCPFKTDVSGGTWRALP